MAAISKAAGHARPYILPVDLIGVFGSHMDLATIHRVVLQCFGAFLPPELEAGTMGIVLYARDHVVGQVAVFVCQGVDETILIVDDALGQLDRGMVSDIGQSHGLSVWASDCISFGSPVSSTGGFLKRFRPGNPNAASLLRESADFSSTHGIVQVSEESFCENCFLVVE